MKIVNSEEPRVRFGWSVRRRGSRGSISVHVVHFQDRGPQTRVTVSDMSMDLLGAARHGVAVRAYLPRR